MLSEENISDRFVVPTVAAAIDLVVHLGVDHRGRRQVPSQASTWTQPPSGTG